MRALVPLGLALGVYVALVTVAVAVLYTWLALDKLRSPRARLVRAAVEEAVAACLLQGTLLVGYLFWPWWWRRRGRAGETPVLLVHGYGQTRADFWYFGHRLHAGGRGSVFAFNYPFLRKVEDSARALGRAVAEVRRSTGAARVHLVGHSMGGLIARTYVEQQGGAETVASVIMLCSPLSGTTRGRAGVGASSRDLTRGSAFLCALGRPAPPAGVRYRAIWSHADALVVPADSGALAGAGEELVLHDVGHLTALLRRGVADRIDSWLNEAEGAGAPGAPLPEATASARA